MFHLPALSRPVSYVGLYVYDFGTHVAVGYTPNEIRMLRDADAYRNGTAYEIYRVDADGTIELRATSDERIALREAVCFLRTSGAAARRDYDQLRAAAEREPVPCPSEVFLARLPVFAPSDLTAVHYSAGASTAMASWLARHAGGCGDRVQAGTDVCQQFMAADGLRLGSDRLRCAIDHVDRTWDQVLAAVSDPVQR